MTSYNNRPHRSLGGNAPVTVNQENADEIRLDAYLSGKPKSDITENNRNQLKKSNETTKKE